MKRIKKYLLIISIAICLNFSAFSQSAPPPPPPQGDEGGPIGGGAPIGGGTLILMALGAGYLVFKLKKSHQKND